MQARNGDADGMAKNGAAADRPKIEARDLIC
jgi:hypothetical protein